jgi:hypothetical protein
MMVHKESLRISSNLRSNFRPILSLRRQSSHRIGHCDLQNPFLICCCFSSPSRSHRDAPSSVVLKDYQACRIHTYTPGKRLVQHLSLSRRRKRIICRSARALLLF